MYISALGDLSHFHLKDTQFLVCVGSMKCKVKQFHYRPGQALSVPAGWGSQIFRQPAHEGGKVVSLMHRPPLPPRSIVVLISVRGWVDRRAIVRSEGLCQWKIPTAPLGIETATFRLTAQCLNQLRYGVRQRANESYHSKDKGKRQSNSITGLDRPWGAHEFEVPRFQDNRHMKLVGLSALRPGSIPGTHFC